MTTSTPVPLSLAAVEASLVAEEAAVQAGLERMALLSLLNLLLVTREMFPTASAAVVKRQDDTGSLVGLYARDSDGSPSVAAADTVPQAWPEAVAGALANLNDCTRQLWAPYAVFTVWGPPVEIDLDRVARAILDPAEPVLLDLACLRGTSGTGE